MKQQLELGFLFLVRLSFPLSTDYINFIRVYSPPVLTTDRKYYSSRRDTDFSKRRKYRQIVPRNLVQMLFRQFQIELSS